MLRRSILLSLYASVVAFPTLLAGQWSPILTGVSHQLPSQALGESRDIYVVLPPGMRPTHSGTPFSCCSMVTDSCRPRLGCNRSSPRQRACRAQSSSPSAAARRRTAFACSHHHPTSAIRARFSSAGGAGAFHNFLGRELVPHIAAHYRIDGRWGLVGHSLAGLLVIQSFSDPESTFGTFVAISPTLGWQDQAILTSASASLRQPARPRRLFLSTAEEGPRYPAAPTQRLDSLLAARRIPGISWMLRHYQSEDHVTTVPPALYDALRWIYLP